MVAFKAAFRNRSRDFLVLFLFFLNRSKSFWSLLFRLDIGGQ